MAFWYNVVLLSFFIRNEQVHISKTDKSCIISMQKIHRIVLKLQKYKRRQVLKLSALKNIIKNYLSVSCDVPIDFPSK
jgi:hypothetical protein